MQHYHYNGSLTVSEYNDLLTAYKQSPSLTTNMNILQVNPDYYTLWNDRRQMIPKDHDFVNELKWLIQIISVQPKSYWAWHHRLWCLSKVDLDKVWQKEMELINMYLTKDCRNFHVWDYRKRILANRHGDFWKNSHVLMEELKFTLLKITDNFSNYSAWHWRSKVLQALKTLNLDIVIHLINDVDLLTTCFYSDPNDQSAWFYYNWFIDFCKHYHNDNLASALQQQKGQLEELLEMEPNCKWIYMGLFKLQQYLGTTANLMPLKLKFQELDPLKGDYIMEYL